MAIKTPAQLIAQYNSTLPDNNTGDISPADVRNSQIDQTDSWDDIKLDKTEVTTAQFNANKLQGQDIDAGVPVDKQVLVFNSGTGEWEPSNSFKSTGLLTLVDNAVATVISTTDTPVKIDPAVFTATNLVNFAQSTSGRLTYTGAPTKDFVVNVSISCFASSNNRLMTIYIAKNGTVINSSKASNVTISPDPTETSTFTIANLATNDFIELFIENNDNTDNLTCEHIRFMVSTL